MIVWPVTFHHRHEAGELFWLPLLNLLVAFLLLSTLLNFNYPAEHLFHWRLLLPSIDIWLMFISLAVVACFGQRPLFWISMPIWALFLALRLLRVGATVVPMYFNRPFNLYIDSGYLFGLYNLLKNSSRQGDFLLLSAITAALALTVIVSSWYAWQTAARALAVSRIRLWFLGGSGLILAAVLIWGGDTARPPALAGLGQELLFIHKQREQQQGFVIRLEQTARDRKAHPATLNGLEGTDALLFMVESYGRIVFTRPEYRPAMGGTLSRFAEILDRYGFDVVSSYLVSPTYGGASWLAHGTLESGLRVSDDIEDTLLLRSSLPPLASYFRRNGYRTVSVMPGTRFAYPQGV